VLLEGVDTRVEFCGERLGRGRKGGGDEVGAMECYDSGENRRGSKIEKRPP
jgi:hypothetical protein